LKYPTNQFPEVAYGADISLGKRISIKA